MKNYTRKYGIEGLTPGYKKGYSPINSSFAKWLASYDGEIPKLVKDIEELSGCTRWSIISYMYRCRKKATKLINSQPWRHNGPPVLWEDIKGTFIPDKAFDVVRASITRFGFMRFTVRLRTKDVHVFRYTPDTLKKLYDK